MDVGYITKIESGEIDKVGLLIALTVYYHNTTDNTDSLFGFDADLQEPITDSIQTAGVAAGIDLGM